ncbi:ATP-grasp domain-containing protein [Rhodoblastus sp.]|uniref:ATP-grasp domain-containing protein n=1 Tax=Rhodoblastus sp. TaxID=1962975 RepID=UPI003F99C236
MRFSISNSGPATASAPLIGLAAITRYAMQGGDFAPVVSQLVARIERDGADASAWLDLSTIQQVLGNSANRMALQADALRRARHFTHARPGAAPLRLLVLMAPGDFMANTPLEFLLEQGEIAHDALYLSPDRPLPETLPDHDVAFVAAAESDANLPLLQKLAAAAPFWPRPLVNAPERIAALTRDGFSQSMRDAPGVLVPTVRRLGRAALGVAEGLDFPLIARPTGSHAGEGLRKIDSRADLDAYLAETEGPAHYVAPFVDYGGADGLFRKYRIVLIEGAPFAVHMAVSPRWMVHYLNADMIDNPAHRAEEARFMANFDQDFARRHAIALHAVWRRAGLDYVLLDCAETRDGELLIFEAGTAMIIHALDPKDLFPYKAPQMTKIFAAFQDMLRRRAAPRVRAAS